MLSFFLVCTLCSADFHLFTDTKEFRRLFRLIRLVLNSCGRNEL